MSLIHFHSYSYCTVSLSLIHTQIPIINNFTVSQSAARVVNNTNIIIGIAKGLVFTVSLCLIHDSLIPITLFLIQVGLSLVKSHILILTYTHICFSDHFNLISITFTVSLKIIFTHAELNSNVVYFHSILGAYLIFVRITHFIRKKKLFFCFFTKCLNSLPF
jgi:hypothetical protein